MIKVHCPNPISSAIRAAITAPLAGISMFAMAAPGAPQVAFMPLDYALIEIDQSATAYEQLVTRHDAVEIPISWNRWSGDDANQVNYKLNGNTVSTQTLGSGQSATGTATLSIDQGGRYDLVVELCNADGCSQSETKTLVVADTDGSHVEAINLNARENNQAYSNTTNSVMATYFVEWGVYGRNYTVDRLPAYNLTHIIYGFIPICGGDGINDGLKTIGGNSFSALQNACAGRDDFEVAIHDPWAAIQKPQAGHTFSTPYKGNFGQFMEMKAAYPDLKIIPSVGGWTLSDPFFHFGNAAHRQRFVASVGEFLRTWKFFDGIDIDWEFPGGYGATPGLGNADTDGETYLILMQELRVMLDALEAETGREYELTSAIGNSAAKLAVVDYGAAQEYMDYLFPLTYDFHGAWSNSVLGHQTALHASSFRPNEELQTDNLVNILLAQGVEPGKIAVGAAMYGRGWTGVADNGNHLMTGTATGPVAGTWEDGVVDYRQIAEFIASGEWQTFYDEAAEAPYIYRPGTGDLITYDDARSVKAKGDYVQQRQLAGFFSWEIDADNGDILNAMHEGLGHPLASGANRAPSANAGNDQTVTGPANITLDGSRSSDPDQDPLTYQWQQTSGPTVTLSNADSANPSFSVNAVDTAETLRFTLTVSDGKIQATDEVSVTVQANTPANTAPVVEVTSDVSVESTGTVSIVATATDVDGDTLTYSWSSNDGLLTIDNADSAAISVTATAVTQDTTAQLTLLVSDGTDTTMANIAVTITATDDGGNGGGNTCSDQDDDAANQPAYNANTVYLGGDLVSHNSLVWKAKWWTKGTAPGVGVEVWELNSAVELPWSAAKAYSGGDEVNYQERRYRAKWWTQGNQPSTSDVWVDIGTATCTP
ncbi:Chitinase A [BD1-7 clade bacterium]|uniref:chitinase n=1 Tax=BD1-7 clade bacterium TaxID=2029982 RepID=A0A5S9P7P3_9GAMM|nr:Chitinase A [BD1-7 clade bacterium]CAA0099468.1 Chitinase A [BD1-7 clade bacterium]